MFGVPADTAWVWVGLTLASAVMLGVVVGLPTAPPAAERAATTVDDVASSEFDAEATVDLRADSIRLGTEQIGLRGPGGQSHATFSNGPVTPVEPETQLASVLDGTPPETVYEDPETFARALNRSRPETPEWRTAGKRLVIKNVHYGEVNGVLVGM